MVDRIDKVTSDHLRVEAARDSLEEERNQPEAGDGGEGDEKQDVFAKSARETLWEEGRGQTQFRDLNLEASEVDALVLEGVLLKTDPAWLKVKVILRGGGLVHGAYLPLSRALAMRFKSVSAGRRLDHRAFLKNGLLSFKVDDNDHPSSEEATTMTPREHTLSRTLRLLKLNWWHRLGMVDPVTGSRNLEIILAYTTVFVVLSAILFSIWLIAT